VQNSFTNKKTQQRLGNEARKQLCAYVLCFPNKEAKIENKFDLLATKKSSITATT
jgi:hypothetical protein